MSISQSDTAMRFSQAIMVKELKTKAHAKKTTNHRTGNKPQFNITSEELHRRRQRASRQTPLYDNCVLQAPDGQTISMIPLKKMNWYLNRGLANSVEVEGKKIIRLLFEPQGRTMATTLTI